MSNYFKQLPDLLYLDRENKEIRTYAKAKNLFRRIKLRSISTEQLANFQFYNVINGERPDQVAFKFYDDPSLDWVVLLTNNIINVQTEWPMDNKSFERYLEDKYGDTLYDVVEYQSKEIRNASGEIILQRGVKIPADYSFTYFDIGSNQYETVVDISLAVTNYIKEVKIQNERRAIRILRKEYIDELERELEELLQYKPGSAQYQGKYLKMVDDIRINL
tara:strand:- start:877 stop:1533 length:657 start_codon:yes stop_codon:yes gene_type:complete